jgi:Cohesin loading factor
MEAEHEALLLIAQDCERRSQISPAIKSLQAILENDPLPETHFIAGIRLARLYIAHTSNFTEAQGVLHQMVRARLVHDLCCGPVVVHDASMMQAQAQRAVALAA